MAESIWLKQIHIENFKSIEKLTLNFNQGINVIFGENGTGKSNLTKGILKILGPTYPGSNSFSSEDYFNLEENRNLVIKLKFSNDMCLSWGRDSRGKERLIFNERDYISDPDRIYFCPLHIPSNREVHDLPGASKWTPIGRIVYELSKMIEKNEVVREKYKDYMSKCSKTLEESEEFLKFKTQLEKYSKEQLGKRGENIKIQLGLLDNKHILKTLQLFEEHDETQFNLHTCGQGIQSSVIMAALRAFADISGGCCFIVADEPEAYLHPLAQESLCRVFETVAKSKTQIILTTHSPHFISPNYIDGFTKIWMEKGVTRFQQINIKDLNTTKINRGITDCTPEKIIARLTKLMTLQVREGLFARTVVLCEGESEALSMEIWGKILKKDLAREGIAFVSSNGKFSLIDIAEFYSNLKIPVYLIFDSDIYKIQNKSTHAKHNKYLLKFSNGKVEDFPNTDINKNYCVLSPNFENVLRKDDKNYVNIEKEVDDDLGLEPDKQKGIRARFVALKYGELGMPPPKFIKSLIEAIIEFNKKGQ